MPKKTTIIKSMEKRELQSAQNGWTKLLCITKAIKEKLQKVFWLSKIGLFQMGIQTI
jgi:hypothetical protein